MIRKLITTLTFVAASLAAPAAMAHDDSGSADIYAIDVMTADSDSTHQISVIVNPHAGGVAHYRSGFGTCSSFARLSNQQLNLLQRAQAMGQSVHIYSKPAPTGSQKCIVGFKIR